jgi:Carboxypeptidase regulatory-like domain
MTANNVAARRRRLNPRASTMLASPWFSMRRLSGSVTGAGLALLLWTGSARGLGDQTASVEQRSRQGTGVVSGVVIDAGTKQPIDKAVISLYPAGVQPPGRPTSQITDARGRFVFDGLPPYAQYTVRASKFGYIDGSYGAPNPGAGESLTPFIALRDREWIADLRVALLRPAAVSGVVLDDRGVPIVGAFVRPILLADVVGRRRLAIGAVVRTDDRGVYRLHDLMPGSYFVQVVSEQHSVSRAATDTEVAGEASASAARLTQALTAMAPFIDADPDNVLDGSGYPMPPRLPDGRLAVYPTTFFPNGGSLANAVELKLTAGEERQAIDFSIAPAPGARVGGTIDGATRTYAGARVRLVAAGSEELGAAAECATALVDATGRFMFTGVPAGSYTLALGGVSTQYQSAPVGAGLAPSIPPAPGLGLPWGLRVASLSANLSAISWPGGVVGAWAREFVTVDGRDVLNLVVRPKPLARILGHYVWDGRPPTGPVDVIAEPAQGSQSLGIGRSRRESATPDAFVIDDLAPGEYVLSLSPALALSGIHLRSVICAGQDVTDRSIDTSTGADVADCVVTLTSQSTAVAGTVTDRDGRPARDAEVLAFPAQRELWAALGLNPARMKGQQVTTAGEYRFQTLPAGDYFLIAVPAAEATEWMLPPFLKAAAARATRVSLTWGGTARQDLVRDTVR